MSAICSTGVPSSINLVVGQPPGDRGDRLAVVRRLGAVHGELARAQRHRRRTLAAAAERPAARNRLAEGLLIGQPVPSPTKLMPPVPLKLIDQLGVPVNVHALTLE